jgi:glutamate racemase
MRQFYPSIEIHPIACPLFVPLVEEGFYDHPSAALIAEAYLRPLQKKGIDAALLACTHYPLLKPLLQKTMGPDIKLIEPANLCAEQARDYLASRALLNLQKAAPRYEFYASDDPEKFARLGKIFFETNIERVERKIWVEKK